MNSGAIPRSLKQKANSTPQSPQKKETQNAVFKLCWEKKTILLRQRNLIFGLFISVVLTSKVLTES